MTFKSKFNTGSRDRICVICGEHHLSHNHNAQSSFCKKCYTLELRQEEHRVDMQNKRALKEGLPATLTVANWLKILDHFKWKCAYCSKPFRIMEHIISIAHGGGTTALNVVPACLDCNSKKDVQKCMPESKIIAAQEQLRQIF